ncbi:MAG: recombinase family protein [Bacillota bacterium]|nr:recombinase family protein [Bacillota bacterium]
MSQANKKTSLPYTRVAIYVRLSDEDKDKKNNQDYSESIKNQLDLATSYAQKMGWLIVGVYSDDDYSGVTADDRPDFTRLISDCEAGKIDVVLCKNMSRFARNIAVSEEYLETKFLEWGVRFIGLTDHTDNFDYGQKKARQISGLTNQWYAEDISNNVRAVFKTKREKGDFIGSFAVYGYMKHPGNKNKLIIDQEAAEVVRLIFQLYLQGNGTAAIAQILNKKSVPNPSKYKEMKGVRYHNHFDKSKSGLWNKTSVKRILRDQTVIGNLVQYKKEKIHFKTKKSKNIPKADWVIVEGTHEPIIDRDTFYKVQELLDSRIRSSGHGQPHIFAGKVRCKDCGNTLSKFSNGKNVYLGCSLYRLERKECSKHNIRFDKLTNIIEGKIRIQINKILKERDQFLQKLLQGDEHADVLKHINNQIIKLNLALKDINDGLKSLYIDKSKGQLDEMLFLELKENFIAERKRLETQLEELNLKLTDKKKETDRLDYWLAVLERYSSFLQLDRKLVVELIDHIQVGEVQEDGTQEVIIYYNFSKVY